MDRGKRAVLLRLEVIASGIHLRIATLLILSLLPRSPFLDPLRAESASVSFLQSASVDLPPPGFKIAFIGDQGLGTNAVAVLELIKSEGADMVLHQGDFDYTDNPDAWDRQINDVLGPDFPYFASVGNHDTNAWPGYQAKLQARLDRIPGASCSGDLGVNAACRLQGVFFILSGPGTLGSGHTDFIRSQLSQDDSLWSICSWHKNQAEMQVGMKTSEVGWGPYEECRVGGAIIATGHEHSYSRTYLMSDLQNQVVASTSSTLQLEKGKSFVFVSGLGGKSIRSQFRDDPWWASIYTSDQGASYGALFCTFNVSGQPDRASCYFKDILGRVPDRFDLISAVEVPTFSDVPFDHPYYKEIEALYRAGFVTGCGADPLRFCPDVPMSRAEAAVFVERGAWGAGWLPPEPGTSIFADIDLGYWGLKWASALFLDGYTAGCGTDPLRFCPELGHTRAESAVFFLRMLHGPDFFPPQPQGVFADVALEAWQARWAEAAFNDGLIPACSQPGEPLRFCPDDPLSRGSAASIMAQAEGLVSP